MIATLLAGIMLAVLPSVAAAAPLPDADLDPAEQVVLLCDAGQARLQVRALGDHDDGDSTYAERKLIRVADFVGLTRGQYRSYKTRSVQLRRVPGRVLRRRLER